MPDEYITTVSYNQGEIIKNILSLYVPQRRIDVDLTFGSGCFYKGTDIEEPIYKYDINPKRKDVVSCDCRSVPIENKSVRCVMFDPPFLAAKGKSLSEEDREKNKINSRFGVYPTEEELHSFYKDSLKEAYRILDDNGILIFKCQDKVSKNKQFMSHVYIMNEAVKCGFYPIDLFILIAKSRLVADWQKKNQKHARKYHSYFWVFQKKDVKVNYSKEYIQFLNKIHNEKG